jgi:hypothetical protein
MAGYSRMHKQGHVHTCRCQGCLYYSGSKLSSGLKLEVPVNVDVVQTLVTVEFPPRSVSV